MAQSALIVLPNVALECDVGSLVEDPKLVGLD